MSLLSLSFDHIVTAAKSKLVIQSGRVYRTLAWRNKTPLTNPIFYSSYTNKETSSIPLIIYTNVSLGCYEASIGL